MLTYNSDFKTKYYYAKNLYCLLIDHISMEAKKHIH